MVQRADVTLTTGTKSVPPGQSILLCEHDVCPVGSTRWSVSARVMVPCALTVRVQLGPQKDNPQSVDDTRILTANEGIWYDIAWYGTGHTNYARVTVSHNQPFDVEVSVSVFSDLGTFAVGSAVPQHVA